MEALVLWKALLKELPNGEGGKNTRKRRDSWAKTVCSDRNRHSSTYFDVQALGRLYVLRKVQPLLSAY